MRELGPWAIDHNAFGDKPVSFDPAELFEELKDMLISMPDADLRRLSEAFTEDEGHDAFEISPTAQRKWLHHPYRFGHGARTKRDEGDEHVRALSVA